MTVKDTQEHMRQDFATLAVSVVLEVHYVNVHAALVLGLAVWGDCPLVARRNGAARADWLCA